MEPSRVKIFFLRDEKKFPVACLASTVDGEQVRYAFSTHNPKDPYDKHLARHIAEERLAQKKMVVNAHGSTSLYRYVGGIMALPEDHKQIKPLLLEEVAKSDKFPQRIMDAAKLWLDRKPERDAKNAAKKALGERQQAS